MATSALTEVVQWIEESVVTYSEGPCSNPLEAKFFPGIIFFFRFFSLFFICVVHIASNIMC